MNVDPLGYSFFLAMLITGIILGASIGGISSGVSAYKDGQRGWGLFGAIAGGAVIGGAMGGILVLGGAAGLSAAIAPIGMTIAGFTLTPGVALGLSIGIGVGASLISYSLEYGLRTDKQWTLDGFALSGISGGFKSLTTFGIGYFGGKAGAFDKMILTPMLKNSITLSKNITYGLAKSVLSNLLNNTSRTIFTNIALKIGETLTKFIFVSLVSSAFRWIIDKIFGF